MEIFQLTAKFPKEEIYSLTDQIRRSSRSVCSNLSEAWRKRRYEGSFLNKLNDAEAEASETQTWLEFSVKCGYLDEETAKSLYQKYDRILGKLVNMIANPEPWLIPMRKSTQKRRRGEEKRRLGEAVEIGFPLLLLPSSPLLLSSLPLFRNRKKP